MTWPSWAWARPVRSLANLLGLCGLRVVVLERERTIHNLPRAVHFDGEVMRIFQTLGVADRVAAVSRVNAGMRFVDPSGELILDWPRPRQVGSQGWYPSYRFHQPDLEEILRDRLREAPTVDVHLGAEVTSIDQSAESATVTFRSGDRQQTLAASYVVGCDGARSLIREQVTNRAEDLGFHERWLVVDLLLCGERPDLGDFTIQYCHPHAPATYVRGPRRRRRWEIAIAELPDAQALAPEHIWQRLSRWLIPSEADVERAAVYTFHSVISSSWRQGRLLIAGDAAHQSPRVHGAGHVCRNPRCRESGLEARPLHRQRVRPRLARHLPERASPPRPGLHQRRRRPWPPGQCVGQRGGPEISLPAAGRIVQDEHHLPAARVPACGKPAHPPPDTSPGRYPSETALSRTNWSATARPFSPTGPCSPGGTAERLPNRKVSTSGTPAT